MSKSLRPKAASYFDLFERHADRVVEGARLFEELLGDLGNSALRARRIKEVEHEADMLAHAVVDTLHKAVLAPFARNEILRLVHRLDDVIDQIENAAERLALYEVREAPPGTTALARILREGAERLRDAVGGLRHLSRAESQIREACIEVNRLENEADEVTHAAIARLFREQPEPLEIVKWKEVLESLEFATDRCEDVANIIEGLLIENG